MSKYITNTEAKFVEVLGCKYYDVDPKYVNNNTSLKTDGFKFFIIAFNKKRQIYVVRNVAEKVRHGNVYIYHELLNNDYEDALIEKKMLYRKDRILAKTLLSQENSCKQLIHIDGDQLNCFISNLVWKKAPAQRNSKSGIRGITTLTKKLAKGIELRYRINTETGQKVFKTIKEAEDFLTALDKTEGSSDCHESASIITDDEEEYTWDSDLDERSPDEIEEDRISDMNFETSQIKLLGHNRYIAENKTYLFACNAPTTIIHM